MAAGAGRRARRARRRWSPASTGSATYATSRRTRARLRDGAGLAAGGGVRGGDEGVRGGGAEVGPGGRSRDGPRSRLSGRREGDLEAAAARDVAHGGPALVGLDDAADDGQARAPRRPAACGRRLPRQPVSKTRGRSSSGMPPQPSVTERTTAVRRRGRAATATVPSAGVRRIALTRRLPRTRLISLPSTSTGTGSTRSPTSRTPCSRASGSAPARASPTRSYTEMRVGVRASDPAWMRESSKRSPTMSLRRSTSVRICRR